MFCIIFARLVFQYFSADVSLGWHHFGVELIHTTYRGCVRNLKLLKPSVLGHKICGCHGCVKSNVIKRRQHQLGRMADFLPPVTFSVFDL